MVIEAYLYFSIFDLDTDFLNAIILDSDLKLTFFNFKYLGHIFKLENTDISLCECIFNSSPFERQASPTWHHQSNGHEFE